MPHSSGGGSYSGGSHYSSHSSSSSSSYGYSSGGSSRSARVSKKPFPGAKKYVYYHRRRRRNARPIYYYATSLETDYTIGTLILSCAIWTIVGGCILFLLNLFVAYTPKPLDLNSYDSTIVIEDHLDLIDEEALMPTLETFRKTTGVTPGIEVVTNNEWKSKGNLEAFAYNEYLRIYKDEKHWLFVLSYPEDLSSEWSWEGMIGDNCITSVNSNLEDRFTELMQESLQDSKPENVSEHIAEGYAAFLKEWPNKQISYFPIFLMAIALIIYVACMYISISYYFEQNQITKAIPVPSGSKEIECEYCGSIFLSKTVQECPNCGAKFRYKNLNG